MLWRLISITPARSDREKPRSGTVSRLTDQLNPCTLLPKYEKGHRMDINDKVGKFVADSHPVVRYLVLCVYLFFPLMLLLIGYAVGYFFPAFHNPLFRGTAVENEIWPPLMVLIILALVWLLLDLFYVSDRDTKSRHLQLYGMASVSRVIAFSVAFGYLLRSDYGVRWWFVVPFCAVLVDVFTTGWAAINNATQKPFLSDKGRE